MTAGFGRLRMQDLTTRAPDEELPSSRPRSFRLIALGLAVVLLGAIAYVTYLNASDSGADPEPFTTLDEPDFSLTDEEAIARFEQLSRTALEATKTRDLSLVPGLFTADSPMKKRLIQEIRKLQEQDVLERSSFERQSVEILSNTSEEIHLLELTTYLPCFKSESGEDVTVGPPAIEQEVDWTLRLEDSIWLIHESTIEADEKVAGQDGHC